MAKTEIRGAQIKDTDVTVSDIADGAVSLAKMANLAANSIVGNNTNGAATPQALSIAQVNTMLGISAGSGNTISLYNKSGVTMYAGDVVIFDKNNASSFSRSATWGDLRMVGVVKDTSIANNALGNIAISNVETVNVQGNVAIGQALIQSTTAGRACANGGARQPGILGFALTAYSGGGAGTVSAILSPSLERAAAQVLVEGVTYVNGSAGTGVLNCGTNPNRLVVCLQSVISTAAISVTVVPKIGGLSFSQTGADWTSWGNFYAYSLARLYVYKDPGTGSQTATNLTTGGTPVAIQSYWIALSGVAASSYNGTANATTITGTVQSVNTSDAIPGDLVVGFMLWGNNVGWSNSVTGHGANQVPQLVGPIWNTYCLIDTKPATGSAETMSWTIGTSAKILNVSVPIRPL